ncbi:acyl carrier protein [Pseudomonas migulae]|uniref:acyl carrier protein n=1 Tax=Pseudomonas migulae TaxID=78543 RepID=UPI00209CCA6A|nr:phosphopantetheine-binding protein [Pseudomonas migulae]MCP1520984.1 acyl carrier protein [Pseudomonas migulae]
MSISMLDAEKRIINILESYGIIDPGKVLPHSRFNDLGMDELDVIDFIERVEREFGIVISDVDVNEFTTSDQVASYVSKRSDAR